MPKIIKFMNEKTRGFLRKERSDEVALTSPRSLEDAEELFQGPKSSVFAFDAISPAPIDSNGDIRRYDDEIMEETEEPTEKDYDFDYDSYYQTKSPASDRETRNKQSVKDHPSILRQRAKSVQRPMQGSSYRRRRSSSRRMSSTRRAASVGRTERFHSSMPNMTVTDATANDLHESGLSSKKRKSKMEKILQLQEKNQRYKDEYRKIQKDRKALKKALEKKKSSIEALSKECETQASESKVLKLKLSEALQQLDKADVNERSGGDVIASLKSELADSKADYTAAVSRLTRMRDDYEKMKQKVAQRDEKLNVLKHDLAEATKRIDSLEFELDTMQKSKELMVPKEEYQEQQEEIGRLQLELSSTLQRASTMVKEREDAISDLLRENEDMKKQIGSNDGVNEEMNEEVQALRTELEETSRSLEQSQDRTLVLEEEVEAWISKSQENDAELVRLRLENEDWQKKHVDAVDAVSVAEESARNSTNRAIELENELIQTRQVHEEQIDDLERKHTEALLDQKEKAQKLLKEAEKDVASNPQEMMLQKAVADRKAKENNGSWGLMQRVRGDGKSSLSPEAQRIKELEELLASQSEELLQMKSEMVRMKTSYNDTLYKNKKRIEELENQCSEQGNETDNKASFPDLLANP